MKNVLLLSVLLILLPGVISSQSNKERITDPFRTIHKEASHTQMFGKEQAKGVELPGVIQKNKKANKPSSVSYRPTKITIKDSLRYTYTYNSSGEYLTELDAYWTNNAWVDGQRFTYTYDNSGKMLTELYEDWTNNAWVNNSRVTYTYDNSGNLLTELREDWTNNAWVISLRYTYTYDNSGNLLTELYEDWTNNVLVFGQRFTYTYDNSGKQMTYLWEDWTNNVWVISYRETYTYDNSGNELTSLGEIWTNNAWVASWRFTYTYDNSGNLLIELGEYGTNNAWVNSSRGTYTYDNNSNCIHGEQYSWQNSSWVPYFGYSSLTYNHNQDWWNGQFSVVDIEYATFTGVANESTGVQSFNLHQNYPNPFNPVTTINYSLAKEDNVKLTVYNAIGSKVATIVDEYKPAGNYSVNFNGSNLASGIYLYKIEAGQFSQVKKMMLLK